MVKKKVHRMDPKEKFWNKVDLLSQEKIYNLLTRNLPLSNLKLITEYYEFEDRQEKLSGLFLHRDADYRTLLSDVENQYDEELPDEEYLAEEIALWYCRLVVKALIRKVSEFPSYDPSYFNNLADED